MTFGPDAEHPSGREENIHGLPPPDVIHATRESASEVRSHIDTHKHCSSICGRYGGP